jgi:PAS domain S-box-containing protein
MEKDQQTERVESRPSSFIPNPSSLIPYGVAILATAVCLLLRLPLRPLLGNDVPHMTFFPAVMIAAYFGGIWPGLLATLLSAAAANFFLTGQLRYFHVSSTNDMVALSLFLLVGAIISGLCELLHRTQRRILADERRQAEEALSQERYLLRTLMDNLPDTIYFKDAASRFLRINKALTAYFGLKNPAGAIGKTDFDFFTQEHTQLAVADEQQIIRTGQPIVGKEEKRIWLDGSVRWLSTTKMPFRDRDGTIIGTFGVSRDITKVKQAEQALRESEQRWRCLTESLPHLVWAATADGSCDYFSTQWTQHTGIPESDLLGWRWLVTLHPDDREPTQQFWLDSVAGRRPYDVEYRVRRQDSVYRWFKTRGVPIRDGEGKIVKWFGTCTDITDLRQTEHALRESEERFRGTFENAAVGIVHTDAAGRFLLVNDKFCNIVGYRCDELIQKTFRDITHSDDVAASNEPFMALMRGELPAFGLEKRYVRKDGSLVWVEVFVSLKRDAAGKPAYAIAVLQDISERKQLEAKLRQAMESAEAANRAKDEFLANVSHEIRTPMNAILGMTELALDTTLSDDQRQCLNTVKSAADNLLVIINDLLDFSKIEAGKLELAPADFSLRAAVGDTLRALAVRAHKKGLELIYHVQPDVPDALFGDAGRLRQVLLNLVGNAIKFTEEGEVEVQVTSDEWRVTSQEHWPEEAAEDSTDPARHSTLVTLHFSVRDTGIGIPPDKQERIFRAFEQEDTSTTRIYGGTGLGLTIASQLVALMGGKITVDSAPGRGSTFAFTARLGIQPHPTDTTGQPPTVLRGLPVLIVDDNATNRHILEEWLRGWQMKPAAVGDSLAALDALWHGSACGRPYALVLLDSRMPNVDGLALAGQIRQRGELSATRIILLTSGDRPADLARSSELRIDAHLLKPVQPHELLETIYRVLQGDEAEEMKDEKGSPVRDSYLIPHPSALQILVAEDNEFNAQLLEQLLGRRGHRVRVANNGREALAQVDEGAFDLLLLDVHMPGLDGFQVIRTIRERERSAGGHLPVLALTARSRKVDRDQCLAAGMDDFLAKPIQAADLEAAIERLMGARGSFEGLGSNLLDSRVLLAACGGDAAILEKICQALGARLPDQMTAIRNALHEQDMSGLREAAHKLSGMVAAFSTIAGNVAADLEDCAAEGRRQEAQPLVEQLETMTQEVVRNVGNLSLEALRRQAQATADDELAGDQVLEN